MSLYASFSKIQSFHYPSNVHTQCLPKMCWQSALPTSNFHFLPSEIEGISCQPPEKPVDHLKHFFAPKCYLSIMSVPFFLLEWTLWQQSSHYCQQEGFIGAGQWGLASPLVVKADSLDSSGCVWWVSFLLLHLVMCTTEFDANVFEDLFSEQRSSCL